MVVCVVLQFRFFCKWGLQLGPVYVGKFMVGYILVIGKKKRDMYLSGSNV